MLQSCKGILTSAPVKSWPVMEAYVVDHVSMAVLAMKTHQTTTGTQVGTLRFSPETRLSGPKAANNATSAISLTL